MKHYGVYHDTQKIVVSYAGQPVIIAEEDWQLLQLSDQCRSGQLVLPVLPEPVKIYDQPWLLELGGKAMIMASELWRG